MLVRIATSRALWPAVSLKHGHHLKVQMLLIRLLDQLFAPLLVTFAWHFLSPVVSIHWLVALCVAPLLFAAMVAHAGGWISRRGTARIAVVSGLSAPGISVQALSTCGLDVCAPSDLVVPAHAKAFVVVSRLTVLPPADVGMMLTMKRSAVQRGLRLSQGFEIIQPGGVSVVQMCIDNISGSDIQIRAGEPLCILCEGPPLFAIRHEYENILRSAATGVTRA
jgi:hypothetical protein